MPAQVLRVPVGVKNLGSPGLVDVVEVSIPQRSNEALRVQDLVSSLDDLNFDSRRVVAVKINGAQVARTRELDRLIPENTQGAPRFIATTVQGPFVKVVVKPLTGQEIRLELPATCKVRLIKFIVAQFESNPQKEHQLEYASLELEDNRTLDSYNYKSGRVIDTLPPPSEESSNPCAATIPQQMATNNAPVHTSDSNLLRSQNAAIAQHYSMRTLMQNQLQAPLAFAPRTLGCSAAPQAFSFAAAQSFSCAAASAASRFSRAAAPRSFADVSDNSLLERLKFSQTAPQWRRCGRGLNIEGRCTKRGCETFGKVVICLKGFSIFNLLRDSNVSCPMCNDDVTPMTCGFYECEWKFEGLKAEDGCFVSSPWKAATGKQYHRFRSDESEGTVEWKSLLISVKPAPASIDDECAVCFDDVSEDTKVAESCGHCCHSSCARHVESANAMNGTLSRCGRCFEVWN